MDSIEQFSDDGSTETLGSFRNTEDSYKSYEDTLLNGIKDDIKKRVREDIKEELAKYDLSKLDSQSQAGSSTSRSQTISHDDDLNGMLPEMDVKYQQAYRKMQKLDDILRSKLAREREVKLQRKMLEKRLREELDELEKSGRRSKEEMVNTMKFLAIGPSSNYDESFPDEYSETTTPVFQTEYVFENESSQSTRREEPASSSTGSNKTDDDKQREKIHKRKSSKDFIKRNRELAAAANEVIAMTPEEHLRLEHLLEGLDQLPELPEELEDVSGTAVASLYPGEGYSGTDDESRRLQDIEHRLQTILSPEEYASSRLTERDLLSESHYRHVQLPDNTSESLGLDGLGERALAEVKEHRSLNTRMELVESRLSSLNTQQFSDRRLSSEEMKSLVDECSRSLSQLDGSAIEDDMISDDMTIATTTSYRTTGSLDRSTLDTLLADARACGVGSNWPAVIPEEEEQVDDDEERLVLPDITLFENMSAPRSSRSSSRLHSSSIVYD